METIGRYISALFAKLPATLEILHLKDQVQQDAERAYEASVRAGHSENEALGEVIASLGTIEELLARYGVEPPQPQAPGAPEAPQDGWDEAGCEPEPLSDEVEDYLDAQYTIARMNAVGVGLCVFSPACSIFFGSIPLLGYLLSESVGIFGLFGCVAVGVMLFIYASSMQKSWKGFACDVRLTAGMREELRRREMDYAAERTHRIALGVGLCIVSSACPAILNDFGIALMFLCVAVGVYLLILSGVRAGACRKLLRKAC